MTAGQQVFGKSNRPNDGISLNVYDFVTFYATITSKSYEANL